MLELSLTQKIVLFGLPLLFAITVHETAHGFVAKLCGDRTAQMMGRLTLNPIKHIDPIGTLLIPAVMLMVSNFVFGWAKPVPVTWQNLKNPKRDMALVALAGPGANLLMALMWAIVAKIALSINVNPQVGPDAALFIMGQAGIFINLLLMVLNLLPIPPLDGSRVLTTLLPPKAAYQYNRLEPYGFFILLFLMFTRVLYFVMAPMIFGLYHLIAIAFGLGA